jgi:adenosine deaminase
LGETAVAHQVRYLQVAFVPSTHQQFKGMPYDEVWGGIREGADWVERELGVRLQFAPDFPRTRRPGDSSGVEATVEWAIAHQHEGPVTINSDDPPMFNTTLTDELLALARAQAFTAAELAALIRTGVEVSFLPAAEKAVLRARIDAELTDAARQAGVDL